VPEGRLASVKDEDHRSRRDRETAKSTRRCRSQRESGIAFWIDGSSETVAASGKQKPGVNAAGRSKQQPTVDHGGCCDQAKAAARRVPDVAVVLLSSRMGSSSVAAARRRRSVCPKPAL